MVKGLQKIAIGQEIIDGGLKNFTEEFRYKKIKNQFEKDILDSTPLIRRIEDKDKMEQDYKNLHSKIRAKKLEKLLYTKVDE